MFGLMRNNDFLRSYNPFREMEEFENNAFKSFFGDPSLAEFKTDLSDEGDHYELEADLPGFDKKDINLQIEDNQLIIRAERHSKYEQEDQQNKIVRRERSYGSYSRAFDMAGIDTDNIKAKYENGVLKLELPKLEKAEPEIKKLDIE